MLVDPDAQLLSLLTQQQDTGYIGEPVSQLAHALQCAASAGSSHDESLVLAALLHDIGHFCDPRAAPMADLGVRQHESVGAEFIRACGLDEAVADLVEQHVNAKRYLVATRPEYRSRLSGASQQTLTFQGGPMTPAEVADFEALPRFNDILKLRAWDEAAKQPEANPPALDHYAAMLRRNRQQRLTVGQRRAFAEDGYLHLRDWYNSEEVTSLVAMVDALQALPERAGYWMKYYEQTRHGRQLCRIENFVDYQPGLAQIAMGRSTLGLVSELMAEPAVLYKEKLNLKLAGGNGFAAHQDAPAFTTFGQQYHITLMLSIDATSAANGCLEVVRGGHKQGLLAMNPDLTLAEEVVAALDWQPVETQPGDLLLFDSYLPHRSAVNQTHASRRALYMTYNRQAEGGDVRAAYFAAKRQAFPPDNERVPGQQYDGGVFNVGNPVER